MILDDTATILCKIDSKYKEFVRNDGTILVKLRKNLRFILMVYAKLDANGMIISRLTL